MKGLALFEGSWQKVLIKAIVLLLVLYVVYMVVKKLTKKQPPAVSQINEFIENELPNTTPTDNSNNADPETISDSEAQLIANNLEVYMDQWGTNEGSTFAALQCLNGASLNKVYAEFGARDYDGTMLDLYGWFSEEFSNIGVSYYNSCVPECNSFFNDCFAMTYLREIWSKSSIPVSF